MVGAYGGLRGPNLTRVADRITTQQMEWRILKRWAQYPPRSLAF